MQSSSDAALRISIEHLLEGVQVIGRDWTYLYVNGTAAHHGQREVHELVGRTMMSCYPGIDGTPLFAVMQRVMAGRRAERLRNEFTYPEGDARWFDLLIEPVPDGICVLSVDVTDRQHMVARLARDDERTRFAMESARMGVWELRLASGEVYWSESMERIAGLDRGHGPTTLARFIELVDPEDRERIGAATREAARSGRDLSVEFRLLRPDGHRIWMEGHGRVVTDGSGRPEVMIGVGIDITERRSTELQLQQAQKMEAIGRLAGGIAHDFNNQLTAILGYVGMLLERTPPGSPPAVELGEIKNAAERSALLTRQLLAFSRRQVLEIEPLSVNEVIGRVDHLLRRLIGEDIGCELQLDPGIDLVKGDAGQLEHVLANLAVNARDAMPAGGRLTIGTATVDLTAEDARHHPTMTAGRYTVLSVSDTGHGMDEATRARIFDPFFTTKEPGKGTGLGLSTVYGIVKQMNGFIWVYSEIGIGTTFKLYLPVTDESIRAAPPVPVIPAEGGHEIVLVIEDEPGVRSLTVRALRRQGYTVLEAGSGEEATAILEREDAAVDLILTDVVLSGLSGPELIRGLKRRPVRALFMSGYSERHVQERGFGTNLRLLEKPFTVQQLLRKVREALLADPA